MLLLSQIADQMTGQNVIVTQTGWGLGSIIAVVCSWDRNRSILWAIVAAILSWLGSGCELCWSGSVKILDPVLVRSINRRKPVSTRRKVSAIGGSAIGADGDDKRSANSVAAATCI